MAGKDKDELERFKTEINLTEYAASKGYVLSPKESYKNVAVMRSETDKINISKGPDGHWVYHSWKGQSKGSIIDFAQEMEHKNLGEVRKALRSWIGEGGLKPTVSEKRYVKNLEHTPKDRAVVNSIMLGLQPIKENQWLQLRDIDRETLENSRFAGKILSDLKLKTHVVFPHVDREGLSGLEVRKQDFKGFFKGSEKGLWCSVFKPGDNRVVVCESAIDALSYHQLKGDEKTAYVSTGGSMSEKQKDLVNGLISKNKDKQIVLGFDNDQKGREYCNSIQADNPGAKNLSVDLPPGEGKDWNDVLKDKHRSLDKGMELRMSGPGLSM